MARDRFIEIGLPGPVGLLDRTFADAIGIGDDTANMAAMLLLARWAVRNQAAFQNPLLFVWDTGEEGLGDLWRVRGLLRSFCLKDFLISCLIFISRTSS